LEKLSIRKFLDKSLLNQHKLMLIIDYLFQIQRSFKRVVFVHNGNLIKLLNFQFWLSHSDNFFFIKRRTFHRMSIIFPNIDDWFSFEKNKSLSQTRSINNAQWIIARKLNQRWIEQKKNIIEINFIKLFPISKNLGK
jgi:hypothetical protein